jgi:hypothetical protein
MFDLKVNTRIWTLEMAYLNRCLIYELWETINPLGESAAVKPACMLPDNIRWSELRAHRHVLMVSERNWSATSEHSLSLHSHWRMSALLARVAVATDRWRVVLPATRQQKLRNLEPPWPFKTTQFPPPKHFIVKVKVTTYSFQTFYEIWSFVDGYQHVEETAVSIFRV